MTAETRTYGTGESALGIVRSAKGEWVQLTPRRVHLLALMRRLKAATP